MRRTRGQRKKAYLLAMLAASLRERLRFDLHKRREQVKFLHKPNPKFGFGPIAILVQLRAMLRAKLGADRSTFRATL